MADISDIKNIQVHISKDSPQTANKSRWEYAPAIIAAIASIIAAIVAGIASYSTGITRSSIEHKIEIEKQSTEKLIAENQQATATQIAALQEATKAQIAESEASIDRAKTFAGLVRQISEPNQSTIALLALWKLYPQERKIAIAAALAVKNEDSLKAIEILGDDVKPYLTELRDSGNQSISQAANTALEAFNPKMEAKYLIEQIENNDRVNPFNEHVKSLIRVAKNEATIRKVIAEHLSNSAGEHRNIFLYTLYVVGERERINELLSPINKAPEQYKLISEILDFGDIQESDWPAIIKTILIFLNSDGDKYTQSTAFRTLGKNNINKLLIDPETTTDVIKLCYSVILNIDAYTYSRLYALESLHKWSPKYTLIAISKILSEGEQDLNLIQMAKRIIDGEIGHESLRKQVGDIVFPGALAGKEEWINWREKNREFIRTIEEKN